MTGTEQDRMVGDMVKERNALRRELVLLTEQIHKTQNGMKSASRAANLAWQGNVSELEQGFDYQDAASFAQSISRKREIEARLKDLEDRLDRC